MLRTIFTSAWAGCNAALNAAAPDEHSTGTRNTGFQRLSKPVSPVLPVSQFRAEKRSAQASAHPLPQAQDGLFCVLTVLTVFVCCWGSE